jgi:hypothetical protein
MNDDNPNAVAVEPVRRASALRIGLVGTAAAALIAIGILAAAMAAAPIGSLAAQNTGSTDPAITLANGGGPGGHGPGFGAITITAIDGSNISLETADGWTRTIAVDSGTTYTKGGATIALADLKVGDTVHFRQTLESDGSYTIDSVGVVLPHLSGTVTAVSGSTITLRLADGSTGTVTVDASTTYRVGTDDSAALGDIEVGMVVDARGVKTSDSALTASAVRAGNFGEFRGPGGHGFRGGPGSDGGAVPDASASPTTNG